MRSKTKTRLIVLAGVAALAGGGAAVAGAAGGDDETPVTGSALDRASAAALDHTGGGRVTETEAGDEEGAYEIEVTRADGSQVDVHLNRSFDVLSQVNDREEEGENDDD